MYQNSYDAILVGAYGTVAINVILVSQNQSMVTDIPPSPPSPPPSRSGYTLVSLARQAEDVYDTLMRTRESVVAAGVCADTNIALSKDKFASISLDNLPAPVLTAQLVQWINLGAKTAIGVAIDVLFIAVRW